MSHWITQFKSQFLTQDNINIGRYPFLQHHTRLFVYPKTAKLIHLDMSPTSPTTPHLLLLNGFPGVGKYTIANALYNNTHTTTKSTFIDNHSIIDVMTQVHPERTPEHYAMRKILIREAFAKIPEDISLVIMTCGFAAEAKHDIENFQSHISVAR